VPNTKLTPTLSRRRMLKLGAISALSFAAGLPFTPSVFSPKAESEPDMPDSIAHLLRRAGFGATPTEIARYRAMGLESAIWELINYESVANDEVEAKLAALAEGLDMTKLESIQRWWLVRMLYTQRPLQEKMVLFWHGLLTSGRSRVVETSLLLDQNNFFRANALGNFGDITKGISKDAAMLIWLDGRNSRKGKPNENYARELMELFTTGEGKYTERDVRESARAFTGWTVDKDTKQVVYNPKAHDAGVKQFLGRSGVFNGDDIVDILMEQRVTGEFIAKKLFSFFAYRNPSPETIKSLADTFFSSGYSIKAVVEQILTSEEFYSPRAYRALVKSPTEYVVGSIKALELDSNADGLPWQMRRMGQSLFDPPNVAGWPGGPAWINSSTWLARLNFANRLSSSRKNNGTSPLDLNLVASNYDYKDPGAVRGHYTDHLVDGDISPGEKSALDHYLYSGDTFSMDSRSLDKKGRTLVYLLLASPEYQLN